MRAHDGVVLQGEAVSDDNAAFADVNIAAAVFREYRLELTKADTLLK